MKDLPIPDSKSSMQKIVSDLYNNFLNNRHKVVRPLLSALLVVFIIIGGNLRAIDIKNNFSINNGFEFYVDMASHFWTQPGGYNFDSGLKIKEHPGDYVFTHNPKDQPTGSFENEKGWMFVLSLIFSEGQKGLGNLADTVILWQMLLDLGVIVCLFFAGHAIAGPLGGSLSALLYALFKPSISLVSWVSYYYWAIPFSALSLVFWTAIYRPEKKKYSLKWAAFLFFLYGALIGFAVFGRLVFLLLPLAMSPLIFFRERNCKRALVLLIVMLIGEGIMLAPQIWLTHKWFDKYTLSTRGKWHHVISGLGFYPNPWGIKDGSDLTAVHWAIDQGGPDLNKPGAGIEPYDNFMKRKTLQLFKEKPYIFWRNLKSNLYAGITFIPPGGVRYVGGPAFYGIPDTKKTNEDTNPRNNMIIGGSFPWLVLLSAIIVFIFLQERLGALISAIFQGGYLAGVICLYLLPVDVHVAGYIPIFVLLMGTAIAIVTKSLLAMLEGALKCWVDGLKWKQWLRKVKVCLREDWSSEPSSSITDKSEGKYLYSKFKILLVSAVIIFILFAVDLYMEKSWEINLRNRGPLDSQTIREFYALLPPETSGGFETWENEKDSPPSNWTFSKNGGVRRGTGEKNVWQGESSLELKSDGQSFPHLYFRIPPDLLYSLIGKTITVEGWVKSANNSPDKISLSLLDKLPPPIPTVFYKNSGNWEKLTLSYKVPNDISFLAITLRVNSKANAPAYFDGIRLKLNEHPYDTINLVSYEREEELYTSASLSLDNANLDTALPALNQMEKEFHSSPFTAMLRQKIKFLNDDYADLLPAPVVRWNMEGGTENTFGSPTTKHSPTLKNTSTASGVLGKAQQFNGKNSYIDTPLKFQDWKGVTISLWVKPELKDTGTLSVILDNGHTSTTDFAIQSADENGEKWVWHCNGLDLFFDLPLNKWSRVVVSADGENGVILAYVNGVNVGEKKGESTFKFGNAPLTIGKLANADDRYFKGVIDEITLWNKPLKNSSG